MHGPPTADAARLRGVVFDLDGTLVHAAIDFAAIRRELGLPEGTPLLEALARMPAGDRAAAERVIDRHETAAAATAEAVPGVADFLAWLDGRGVRRAVFTRNSRASAEAVLARCGLAAFDPVITRDDAPFKPQPQGIWQICAAWGLAPAEVLMLGDYLYDVRAGRNAGARTALLTHGRTWPFAAEAEFVFADYAEGIGVLGEVVGW
jgi:HAD superfamily hydrolase (TIGR01549 family)